MTDVLMYVEDGCSIYVPLTDAAKSAFRFYVMSNDGCYRFGRRRIDKPHPFDTHHLTFETVTKEQAMAQMNAASTAVNNTLKKDLEGQFVKSDVIGNIVVGNSFFGLNGKFSVPTVDHWTQSKPTDEDAGLVPMSKDPLGRLAPKAPIAPLPANALAWTGCGTAPMIEWGK